VLRLIGQLHQHCTSQTAAAAAGEEQPVPTTPRKGETAAAAAADCFLSKKITNKVVTQLQVTVLFMFLSVLTFSCSKCFRKSSFCLIKVCVVSGIFIVVIVTQWIAGLSVFRKLQQLLSRTCNL
jgi:hypothetical protein